MEGFKTEGQVGWWGGYIGTGTTGIDDLTNGNTPT